MTPVWLVVRAGLRARWRSWLVLAVLTGLAGGLVTAVAAGARRTDAAYPALVAWMAVILAAVALAVGIPVGLLCGSQAWRFFAGQLGISDVTRTPVLSFVLLAVAGLALAVAIALVPGISAGRIRPADALRAE
jgi:hypothetical protein